MCRIIDSEIKQYYALQWAHLLFVLQSCYWGETVRISAVKVELGLSFVVAVVILTA